MGNISNDSLVHPIADVRNSGEIVMRGLSEPKTQSTISVVAHNLIEQNAPVPA